MLVQGWGFVYCAVERGGGVMEYWSAGGWGRERNGSDARFWILDAGCGGKMGIRVTRPSSEVVWLLKLRWGDGDDRLLEY